MGPTRPQVLQALHLSSGASPTSMFVYFVIVLVMASHCLAGPTNQMQVTVTEEDMKSGTMDRTVCCLTAQSSALPSARVKRARRLATRDAAFSVSSTAAPGPAPPYRQTVAQAEDSHSRLYFRRR